MTVAELREVLGGMPADIDIRIAADPGSGPSRGVRSLVMTCGPVQKAYIVPERKARS